MKNNYVGSLLIAFAIGLMIFFAGAHACEHYPFLAKWVGGECWFEDTDEEIEAVASKPHLLKAEQYFLQAKALHAGKSDDEVLKAAIHALAQSGSTEAITTLREIVRTHESLEIRKTALYALGQIDDLQVIKVLEEVAISMYHVELRKAAVYALQNNQADEAQQALYRILAKTSEAL